MQPIVENELAVIVAQSGLTESKSAVIAERFADYEAKASEWAEKSKALTVTDEGQKAEMKMAREGRLFLRQLRLTVESTRKELKEEYLQGGRAVDGVAKYLVGLIQPIEDHLQEQENFAVRAAAARKEKLKAERHTALAPYTADPNVYALADLSEEAFTELLNGLLAAKEAREEAARKAEADRLAAVEAERIQLEKEAAEREAQRAENERLKAEAAEREKVLATERAEAERQRQEVEANAAAERAAAEQERVKVERAAAEQRRQLEEKAAADRREIEAKAAKEKAAAEELLRQERATAEKLRQEAAAREAAELKAKQEAQAKAAADEKARIAAEKKAKAAPDREKLLALIGTLNAVVLPELATPEAQQIIANVRGLIGKVNTYIQSKAEEL